ncbi:retention module-containing protein [Pseudomonas sp. NPDC007930]|uniref:retention module-containing protein n=1 Tax=Pseudomonas sp. NPDC007930 TaxID=3364417 RepID=UPI0036EE09FF
MSSVVAIVKSIVGQVVAVSPEGIKRVLVEGDRLFAGEQVETGAGAVTLQLQDGRTLDVGRDSQWSAAAPARVEASHDSIVASNAQATSVDDLQKAIAAGADPTQDLEATAAGNDAVDTGGSGGGGHTVVMLTETNAVVDPTVGFNTAGLDGGQTIAAEQTDATPVRAATLTLSATSTITEEGGVLTYTATLSQAALSATTVTLSNGAQIVIAAGQTSGSVNVTMGNENTPYIDAHSLEVTITGTSGGAGLNITSQTTPAVTQVTDTIDPTQVTVSAAESVNEGSSLTYTISVANAPQSPLVLQLSDGNTVTIATGQTSTTYTVNVGDANHGNRGDDALVQGTTSTTLSVTGVVNGANGNLESVVTSGASATTSITDNNTLTTVAITSDAAGGKVVEGHDITYTFTVSNAPSSNLVLTLSDGGTVTIAANSTSATYTVNVGAELDGNRPDNAYNDADSTTTLSVTGVQSAGGLENVQIGSEITTTITDSIGDGSDNGATTTSVTLAASASVSEGGTITYTATVGAAVTGSPVVVTLKNGETITIAVGETEGSTTSAAVGGDVYQGYPNVDNSITSVTGGNYENLQPAADTNVTTAVTDVIDTTTLTLTGDTRIGEGETAQYTLSLSNEAKTDVVVELVYTGKAANGDDITITQSVTIAAGSSSQAFSVPTLADGKVEGLETYTVSIGSVTGGSFEKLVNGDADSVTTTIYDRDRPVAEGGSVTGSEDQTVTLTWADFHVQEPVNDVGDERLGITLTQLPTDGTLYLNGKALTAADLGTDGYFVSRAEIKAGELTFTPAADASGDSSYSNPGTGDQHDVYAQISYKPTLDSLTGETVKLGIDITPVADPTSISLGSTPATLLGQTWTTLALGHDGGGMPPADLKHAIDTATQQPNGSANTTQFSNTDVPVDQATKLSGVIYLEAGHTYTFSGSGDDTLLLQVGTQVVGSTQWSVNQGFSGTVTPAASGFYTIELYHYNADGPGAYNVNVAVDGQPATSLGASGLPVYANIGAVESLGINVDAHLDSNGDGYYSGYALNHGAEDSAIKLATISATFGDSADGSETHLITISNIPLGGTLTDGTNSYTAIVGGDGKVDVTGWNLANLSFTPPLNANGTINLVATATALETANGVIVDTSESSVTIPVSVVPVNDAPVIGGLPTGTDHFSNSFTEGDSGVPVASSVTLSDVDNTTLQSATITLTNAKPGDALTIGEVFSGLTVNISDDKTTITLTGSASLEDYQNALRAVMYGNSSDNPSAADRTISIVVNDGDKDSLVATSVIDVTPVNDAPTVSAPATLSIAEDSSVTFSGDNAIKVADVDANGSAMNFYVSVSNGKLVLADGTSSEAGGKNAIFLYGTVEQINAKLEGATFTPNANFFGDAGISITVNDNGNTGIGGALKGTQEIAISVAPVNDAPEISFNGVKFTEGDQATAIISNLKITDVDDSTLSKAVVTVSGLSSADQLAINNALAAEKGIHIEYSAGTSSVTYTLTSDTNAPVSIEAYKALIETITFANTSDNPTTTDRTVTIAVTDNGGSTTTLLGASDSSSLTVIAVNDAPTVSAPATLTIAEDHSVTFSGDNAIKVADVDANGSPMNFFVTVSNGKLVLADGTSSETGGKNAIFLYGTVEQINAKLEGATFTPNQDFNGNAGISITVNDNGNTGIGGALKGTQNIAITVTPVNDPTVIGGGSGDAGNHFDATFTEKGAAVQIAPTLTLADVDNTTLKSATVTLVGFQPSDKLNTAGMPDGIVPTVTRDGSNLVVTLTGTASVEAYQQALQAITFSNGSSNPAIGDRTITITVNDGTDDSEVATTTLHVTPVNDAPTISFGDVTFTEGDSAKAIVSNLKISDVDDSKMSAASVTVSGLGNGDVIAINSAYATAHGLQVTRTDEGGTVVLHIEGVANTATYKQLIESITLANGSDNPTAGERTVTISVTDNGSNTSTVLSGTAQSTLTEVAVNDAPVIGRTNGSITSFGNVFMEAPDVANGEVARPGQGSALLLADLTLTDADSSSLKSATVTLLHVQSADQLTASTAGTNLSVNVEQVKDADGNVTSLVLTVTGVGSAADYEKVLKTVTFDNETQDLHGPDRTFTLVVDDGSSENNLATASGTLYIKPDNDAPIVAVSSEPVTFTENGAAMSIVKGLTLTDVDNANLTKAVVTITHLSGADQIAFTGSTPAGVTVTPVTNADGSVTITIEGVASKAQYAEMISSIQYSNSTDTPTGGARGVSITVTDEGDSSTNYDARTPVSSAAFNTEFNVVAVNDLPTLAVEAVPVSAHIAQAGQVIGAFSNVVDLDGDTVTVHLEQSSDPAKQYYALDGNNVVLTEAGAALVNSQGASALPTVVVVPNDGTADGAQYLITPNYTLTNEPVVAANDTPANTSDAGGLVAHYYGDAAHVGSIAQALNYINTAGRTPDASFTVNQVNFGGVTTDGIGKGQLATFLGNNASDVTGTPASTQSAIIEMSGTVSLAAGHYSLKVSADDGYLVLIDGKPVASVDTNGQTHGVTDFTVTGDASHTLQILYWDQGGAASLKVEVKDYDAPDSAYTVLGATTSGNFALGHDTLTTTVGAPLVIDAATLLANDTDGDGDKLTITAVTAKSGGSVSFDEATGKVTFTPSLTGSGQAVFTYTVSDGHGSTTTADVTVQVNALNHAPTSDWTSAKVAEGGTVSGTVVGKDTDVGDTLHFEVKGTTPAGFTWVNQATGEWTFDASAAKYDSLNVGQSAKEIIEYTVTDSQGASSTGRLTLTVNGVNDAPEIDVVTQPVSVHEAAEGNVVGTYTVKDVDNAASSLTVRVSDAVLADGSKVSQYYTVDNGEVKLTQFGADYVNAGHTLPAMQLEVSDGQATTPGSAPASVELTNINPVAVADAANTGIEGSGLLVHYYGDAKGLGSIADALNYINGTGTASVQAPNVTLIAGKVDFGGVSKDGLGKNSLDTFLKGNATDATGSQPTTQSAILEMTGKVTLAAGTYSIKVTADDGYVVLVDGKPVTLVNQNGLSTQTASFTVADTSAGNSEHSIQIVYWDQGGGAQLKVELAPAGSTTYTVLGDAAAGSNFAVEHDLLTTTAQAPLTIDAATLLGNDTDADGDRLSITGITASTHGTATYDVNTGKVVFTPADGFVGTATFTYGISDGHGGTSSATVSVQVNSLNHAPSSDWTSAKVAEGGSVSGTVVGKDADLGDTLHFEVKGTTPAGFTWVNQATGEWKFDATAAKYDPLNVGQSAKEVIEYTVTDSQGASSTGRLTLTVNGVNDAPAVNDTPIHAVEDVAKEVVLAASDVDGTIKSYTITDVAHGSFYTDASATTKIEPGTVLAAPADGSGLSVWFKADTNWSGNTQYSFQATDNSGASTSVTSAIDVTPVSDAPSLTLGSREWAISSNFENTAPGIDVPVSSVAGATWLTHNGSGQVEVQSGDKYGLPATNQVIELERNSGDASDLYTVVQNAKAGTVYTLTFDYSPRAGYTGADSEILVKWGDAVVATLNSATVGLQTYTLNLPVTADGNQTLTFVAASDSGYNSVGGVLDNIQLTTHDNTGLAGSPILLQPITATLNDTDGSETLKVEIRQVPTGGVISDGTHTVYVGVTGTDTDSVKYLAAGSAVDVTGWNLSAISFTAPAGSSGDVALKVVAIATDHYAGATAGTLGAAVTSAETPVDVTVHVLAADNAPHIALTTVGVTEDSPNTVAGLVVGNYSTWDQNGQAVSVALKDGSNPNGYYQVDEATHSVKLTDAGAAYVNSGHVLPEIQLVASLVGVANSPTAEADATPAVTLVNDPAKLTIADSTFLEGHDAVSLVTSGFTIVDQDSTTLSKAVIVVSNASANDVLDSSHATSATQNGDVTSGTTSDGIDFTRVYDSATQTWTVTLTGVQSVEAYQALIQSITFSNSDHPAVGSRGVSVTVTDNGGDGQPAVTSQTATSTVTLQKQVIVSVSAEASVTEGDTIHYVATLKDTAGNLVTANSDMTISLDNGKQLTIQKGQSTSETETVTAPDDYYINTPSLAVDTHITSVTGGDVLNLSVNSSNVHTTVLDNQSETVLHLSGPAALYENGASQLFSMTLDRPVTENTTVKLGYTLQNADGTTSTGSFDVVIPKNGTTGSISLFLTNDSVIEGTRDLTFQVLSVSASGLEKVTFADANIKVIAYDDDLPGAAGNTVHTDEATTKVFSWSDFNVTGTAQDNTDTAWSLKITSLPTDGVLSLNGKPLTSADLANGISVTQHDINAGALTFTPTAHQSGNDSYTGTTGTGDQKSVYASFTYEAANHGQVSSSATLKVDVDPIANAPTLTVSVPAAATTGFNKVTVASAGLLSALGNGGGGAATADLITQVGKATAGLTPDNTASVHSTSNVAVDTATKFFGLVYLEAGKTYTFGGQADDSFAVVVGGTTVATASWSTVTNGVHGVISGSYTPQNSGYYQVDIYHYNQNGAGNYNLTVAVNGGTASGLDSGALLTYTSADALGSSATQHVLANGEGYYTVNTVNHGVEDAFIKLSTITATFPDTDGSETHVVTLSGLGNVQQLQGALAGTTTLVNITITNGKADISGYDLSTLQIKPNTDWNGTMTLTVDAYAAEKVAPTVHADAPSVSFNVIVDAVNDAPTLSVTPLTLVEHAVHAGEVVATYVAGDVDHDALTVSFTGTSNSQGYYAVDQAGNVTLTTTGAAWVNAGNTLPQVQLTVSDGSLTASATGTPVVTLTNAAPTISVTADHGTAHAPASGAVVAHYTTSDADGDALTVTFKAGSNLATYYTLDTVNKTVALTDAGVQYYTTHQGQLPTIELAVTDGRVSVAGSDTPTLSNLAPTVSVTATDSKPHVAAVGSVVGTYSTADGDDAQSKLTVTVKANADGSAAYYSLNTTTHQVVLTEAGVNYYNSHNNTLPAVTLVVTDGRASSEGSSPLALSLSNSAPVANDDISIVGGLKGEYYGYAEGVNSAGVNQPNLTSVAQVLAWIASHQADATFNATKIDYGNGVTNNLGAYNASSGTSSLVKFLGSNANSLDNHESNTSDAIVNLTGQVSLAAGTYTLRITADDGYMVLIDGKQVAVYDGNTPAQTNDFKFTVSGTAVHDIQIVYWDQGANAVLKVQVGDANATSSSFKVLGDTGSALEHNLFVTTENLHTNDHSLIISGATLKANDTDADGDTLTIVNVKAVNAGDTAVLNADGNVVFTPKAGFSGLTYFTYDVYDGRTNSVKSATVTVRVTPVAPVLDLDTSVVGADHSVSYIANHDGVSVSDKAAITLDDAGIKTATIAISNAISGDHLNIGTLPTGIAAVLSSDGTSVTLTAAANSGATNASFQDAIKAITFSSSAHYAADTTRAVTVTVQDIYGTSSNTATTTVAIAKSVYNLIDGTTTGSTINGTAANDIIVGDKANSTVVIGKNANVAFIVDVSGSMANNLTAEKNALIAAIKAVQSDMSSSQTINVGVVAFSDHATAYTLSLTKTVDVTAWVNSLSVSTGGRTNYEEAFKTAANWFITHPNTGAVNETFFITDGQPNRYLTGEGYTGTSKSYTTVADGHGGTEKALETSGSASDLATNSMEGWNLLHAVSPTINAVGLGTSDLSSLNAYDTSGHAAQNVSLDNLAGVISAKTVTAVPAADTVNGGEGNDILFGDTVFFNGIAGDGTAAITAYVTEKQGSAASAADVYTYIKGHLGEFNVGVAGGDDTINGGNGDDILFGQAGDDTLIGGAGNDILIGGKGNDTLYGGTGADTFMWLKGDLNTSGGTNGGADLIKDFSKAEGDKIDISDLLGNPTDANIDSYLKITTSTDANHVTTSTLSISSTGALNASASNADVTIKVSGTDLLSGYASSHDAVKALIDDHTLKVNQSH